MIDVATSFGKPHPPTDGAIAHGRWGVKLQRSVRFARDETPLETRQFFARPSCRRSRVCAQFRPFLKSHARSEFAGMARKSDVFQWVNLGFWSSVCGKGLGPLGRLRRRGLGAPSGHRGDCEYTGVFGFSLFLGEVCRVREVDGGRRYGRRGSIGAAIA